MGALKQKFVTEVDLSSNTATDLIEDITSVTIDIVLTKNKVMPSVHLEEALLKLNHLLCNGTFCDSIKSKLTHLFNLSSEFEVPKVVDMVYQRLIWRICSKMMYKLQEQVFFLMKRNHQAAHKEYKMSDGEVIIFRKHIGTLLRSVYSMGCRSKNNVWQLRCRTLRERFVESVSTLTNEMFLDVKLWVSGDIVLSETALSMFLGIEKIMQSLQDKGLPCLASNIFDDLTNAENLILLEKLRTLSRGILAEDLALDFINDLVQCYSVVSGRLHAKLKVQQISGKEINIATTRENLKRNPTNPKKNKESVVNEEKSSDVDSPASTGKSLPSNASNSTAGSEVKSSSTKSRKKKSGASVSPSTSKPEAKSRPRGKKSTLTDLSSKPATQAKPSAKSRRPPTSTALPSTSATKGKKTAASIASTPSTSSEGRCTRSSRQTEAAPKKKSQK